VYSYPLLVPWIRSELDRGEARVFIHSNKHWTMMMMMMMMMMEND